MESSPLLPLPRRGRGTSILAKILNTWILIVVVGYLFLQQENNGQLSSLNLNGGLLEGLDSNYQPIGLRNSCDGIWSCSDEICDLNSDPSVKWVATRFSPSCPNNSSTWNTYGSSPLFRISRSLIVLVIPLQAVSLLLRIPSEKLCNNLFSFFTGTMTVFFTEIAYILWIIFLFHFRDLSGDVPPSYVIGINLTSYIFVLITFPLMYGATWITAN